MGKIWTSKYENLYSELTTKHPKMRSYNTVEHLGTLGTGNHFIELCLDESQNVWIMLHSGSRGMGNRIGNFFISKAKKEMEKYHITPYLPNTDVSYLVEHSEIYDDYVRAVSFAQSYAFSNREIMMSEVINVLRGRFQDFEIIDTAVNCHHNYISNETYFGKNVIITRKGAVSAKKGELGIVPGSMGAKSYITEGLGNPQSFCSCSHGAGRTMSRTEAKKSISIEQHVKDVEGVECRLDEGVLDESPSAYKDIDAVMESQKDLVKVKHTLKQILNVKG